jgi:hypothetical protein
LPAHDWTGFYAGLSVGAPMPGSPAVCRLDTIGSLARTGLPVSKAILAISGTSGRLFF